jgi:hypothetical protein
MIKILNGDHAQYEIDNKDVPPQERADWPYPSFDARDWAAAFCKINPSMDESNMLGWFANALMRGYDEQTRTDTEALKRVRDNPIFAYLLGEGQLEGRSFGDDPPVLTGHKAPYWWRKHLRALQSEINTLIGEG